MQYEAISQVNVSFDAHGKETNVSSKAVGIALAI